MLKVNTEGKLAQEEIEKLDRRLSVMCSTFGFVCSQVNGQRVCTSVHYTEKPTAKGTEIFIGKIPRKMFEDELIPLFLRAGPLHHFRLMLDFTLKNRGFAFATYTTVEGAEKSIELFDNYRIAPNTTIGVFKSVDNCRLFFGNIPQEFSKSDIANILKQNLIEGVSDIIMYKDLLKPELNRGYVFVEFAAHRDAAMAKKQLYPGCLIVNGQSIFVDWADPIPDVDSKIMAKVTKLFIHHLPLDLTKEDLCKTINKYVDTKTILKIHKQLNYAFVHFLSREAAEIGKELLRALPYPDVVVEWARPRQYSKQQRLESPPTHFCLSLPPKMRRHYQQYISSMISETSSSDSQKSSPNTSMVQNLESPQTSQREILKRSPEKIISQGKAPLSMININERAQNPVPSCRDGIFRKIQNTSNRTGSPIAPSLNGFPRATTSQGAVTNLTPTRLDEPPFRNPLIGLPITLIPTRQRTTPPPMAHGPIFERSKYNDVMFPNTSCRNAFYPSFFNNNTMFTTRETTSVIQNRVMTNVFKPHFEFF